MENLRSLLKRGDDHDGMDPKIVNLLIALLVLLLVSVATACVLLFLRRRRRNRERSLLPMYNKKSSRDKRLTITTSYGNYVADEKRNLVDNSSSPPTSPIPEIRITFPDEEDTSGRRKSGGVVVVRIGEKDGVGLEPYDEELPPYQSHGSERFQSLDLDRIGGLKEKAEPRRYS